MSKKIKNDTEVAFKFRIDFDEFYVLKRPDKRSPYIPSSSDIRINNDYTQYQILKIQEDLIYIQEDVDKYDIPDDAVEITLSEYYKKRDRIVAIVNKFQELYVSKNMIDLSTYPDHTLEYMTRHFNLNNIIDDDASVYICHNKIHLPTVIKYSVCELEVKNMIIHDDGTIDVPRIDYSLVASNTGNKIIVDIHPNHWKYQYTLNIKEDTKGISIIEKEEYEQMKALILSYKDVLKSVDEYMSGIIHINSI